MKHWAFAVLLISGLPVSRALADTDACEGAWGLLNRAKEMITPGLSGETDKGREVLGLIASNLETATKNCRDVPEFWYYRKLVLERLLSTQPKPAQPNKSGKPSKIELDLKYVQDHAPQYTPPASQSLFDPFSLPPAALPLPAQGPPSKIQKKWALVVGINNFQDSRVPALHFAAKDASDFAAYLRSPDGGRFASDRVLKLKEEDSTLLGIREGLGWLRANAQPDDLVVIYLSSHGSPREMDPNGVSYIITRDTNLDSQAKLYATSLQMIDLVQLLNRDIKARRVVLILDTCYSGDAQSGGDPSGAKRLTRVWDEGPPAGAASSSAFSGALTSLTIGFGRAVITASRADEQSWESPKMANGYFTHFLLGALREDQGGKSLSAIFPAVRDRVSAEVQQDHGVSQTPSAEFSERADSIVIDVPEGK